MKKTRSSFDSQSKNTKGQPALDFLVNLGSQLLGIDTDARIGDGEDSKLTNFSNPSDLERPIMERLRIHENLINGWLGIGIQELENDLTNSLGFPTLNGVLVAEIIPESPAEKAGLKRGDILTKVAGRPVQTAADFRILLRNHSSDEKVALEITRNNSKKILFAAPGELAVVALLFLVPKPPKSTHPERSRISDTSKDLTKLISTEKPLPHQINNPTDNRQDTVLHKNCKWQMADTSAFPNFHAGLEFPEEDYVDWFD